MKIAFLKSRLTLPARSGDDRHSSSLAVALAADGHDVTFFTTTNPKLDSVRIEQTELSTEQKLPKAFESGMAKRAYEFTGGTANTWPAIDAERIDREYDAVVAVGHDLPLILERFQQAHRIWYCADELVHNEWSQKTLLSNLKSIRKIMTCAVIERIATKFADDIWVVTPREQKWMRRISGQRQVSVIPNGVDTDYFAPTGDSVDSTSIVFWGALDFAPNIDAVNWFLTNVFAPLKRQIPEACFRVIGARPIKSILRLSEHDGVEVYPDVPDLRPLICQSKIAIFPFFTGAGIKNKLLEGAAMAKLIIASPRAVDGLEIKNCDSGVIVCRHPRRWISEITQLFNTPCEEVARKGDLARNWVTTTHTWAAAANRAIESIDSLGPSRRPNLELEQEVLHV